MQHTYIFEVLGPEQMRERWPYTNSVQRRPADLKLKVQGPLLTLQREHTKTAFQE